MRPSWIRLVLLVLCVLAPLHAAAQETIVREVAASGGGVSANGSFQLSLTVGQPAIGPVSNGEYHHGIGFWYSPWFYVTGTDEPGEETPAAFRLYQNYPNPFNPVTTFRFSLAKDSQVSLRIYDTLGRLVRTVLDGRMDAGIHKVQFEAGGLASGVYFYRIRAESFEMTRKMVLLR